ncbi:S8 family serine peptidase [Paenibacillus xylanexedens]|uniref:S8 family serine peptidase n=1 Tax=Paenibacillus xylanexedens TaxID=528191 RepID=UPI00119DF57D|nr:S8 family serine peptidase [Paenibacillus xylanexedens]
MRSLKKVFLLLLTLSVLLGNFEASIGFAASGSDGGDTSNPVSPEQQQASDITKNVEETPVSPDGNESDLTNEGTSPAEEQEGEAVKQEEPLPEEKPVQVEIPRNDVSEIINNISSFENVHKSNKPRTKFLVRLKKEFSVQLPSPIEGVGQDMLNQKSMRTQSIVPEVQPSLDQDLENKLDLYNVKSLESVNALSMDLNSEEVNLLLSDPKIESIEEDKPIEIATDQVTEVEDKSVKESAQTIPWGIHSTGAYILQSKKGTGDHVVKVAVFDTGIAEHPDLNIAGGVSFDESSTSYTDDKGHGTHIAGTIAAIDNGIGVVGVSPSTEVYAVKVMDGAGNGYTSSVIQGIEWAIDNNIKIINMSFVASQYSDALHEEILRAKEAGIIIVAAAGNSGLGEDTIKYPAKYPEVVAVGAVDYSHHRADFSSTGNELDLVAPGFGIISTTMDGSYGVSSGTSNAAAHVTGAAALIWSHNPSLSSEEVIQKMYDTATPLEDAHETGRGLLNVAKAAGVIEGSIAPLSEENLSGLNTVIPVEPEGEISTASYDLKNNGATIEPGQSVTVSLKLEGDQTGSNPHRQIIVEVTAASNPNSIIATQTITNPSLNVDIPYTWRTTSSTPTGTYYIKYRYPNVSSGRFDDTFIINVAQQGPGQDTYEPNNTILTAKGVNPGNSYISYISSSSDIDYYKLTPDKDGEISITLDIPSSVDYEMDIYNESGIQVGESSNGTGIAERIDFEVSASKSYYIKITGFSGQFSTSPYTLTLSNITTQAYRAPTGLEAVPSATSIKLSWDSMPNVTSYVVRLDGREVGTVNASPYTFSSLEPLKAYKLEVAAVYAGGKSSFSSIQSSTTIPELFVSRPEDINQPAGRDQLYSFTPATTGVYRIRTSAYQGSGPEVDTELSIYSSLQLTKQMASNDDANDSVFSEITISLIGGQTYYVKVNGFDTTPLRARITADVVSSSIPYIYLNQSQDINEQVGNSNVYVFVPATNGKFRIATSKYNGNANSKINDTELNVFSDADMLTPITNGYNDDKGDSVYSEVIVNLSAGTPYYIRVNEANKRKVFARLQVTAAGQTGFDSLKLGEATSLSRPSGEEAYLQFTPSTTGKYRFFTSYYPGSNEVNDTHLALYGDPEMERLLDSNDDVKGYRPYGDLFSKLEVNLNAGTTYYLAVSSFGSAQGLRAQLTVESMAHNTRETAQVVPFGEVITQDQSGNALSISSLYDVDYYKIVLSNPQQLSIVLSEGEGILEDESGFTLSISNSESMQVVDLYAGTYYLKVTSGQFRNNFKPYIYDLAVDMNRVEYQNWPVEDEEEELVTMMRAMAKTSARARNDEWLDATPGAKDNSATIYYRVKTPNQKLYFEVRTKSDAQLVYADFKEGNFKKGQEVPIVWNGQVVTFNKDKALFSRYAKIKGKDTYWAKDGSYDILIYRYNDKDRSRKETQMATVVVSNDPLLKLNRVPLPPRKYEISKKLIKAGEEDLCTECKVYFNRYVYKPTISHNDLQYTTWFSKIYGKTGLQQFWEGSAKLVLCKDLKGSELVHCVIENVGMIPILGEPFDGINGVIYLLEGNVADALWSAGAIIPIAGNGFTAFKKSKSLYGIKKFCGCLPAGTLIKTQDGDKPIEDIKVGDLVLAKDTDRGIQSYKPVEALYNTVSEGVYTLQVDGTDIRTTGNHPFWVHTKGWTDAEALKVGDQLELEDGKFKSITSIAYSDETIEVYNFTVTDYHNYYISDLGILTHNLMDQCQIKNYKGKVTKEKLTGRKAGAPSLILQAELEKATGMKKPKNWAAHHIFPEGDSRFESSRKLMEILKKHEIDANSSVNGVFLPREKDMSTTLIDGQTMATHNGSHAESYYKILFDLVEPVKDNEAKVIETIEYVREELLEGRLRLANLDN